jgi:hypothetical protein
VTRVAQQAFHDATCLPLPEVFPINSCLCFQSSSNLKLSSAVTYPGSYSSTFVSCTAPCPRLLEWSGRQDMYSSPRICVYMHTLCIDVVLIVHSESKHLCETALSKWAHRNCELCLEPPSRLAQGLPVPTCLTSGWLRPSVSYAVTTVCHPPQSDSREPFQKSSV